MPFSETVEISLCADCMSWHANGDTTGIDDPIVEYVVRAAPGISDGWIVSPGHCHNMAECGRDVIDGIADCPFDEGSFSWSKCDSCNRPLGGDRYPAGMFQISA